MIYTEVNTSSWKKDSETKQCSCSKFYGSPCIVHKNRYFGHMLENRQQYQKMLGEELDLTVKVKLAADGRSSTYLPQSTGKIKKKQKRENE